LAAKVVIAADVDASNGTSAAVGTSPQHMPGPPPTPDVEMEIPLAPEALHVEVEFYRVISDFKPENDDELGAFAEDIVSLQRQSALPYGEDWRMCRLELQGSKEQQRPQNEIGVPLATADRITEGLIAHNHLELITEATFPIVNVAGSNTFRIVGGHQPWLQLVDCSLEAAATERWCGGAGGDRLQHHLHGNGPREGEARRSLEELCKASSSYSGGR
jgi:hypothetical protein